MAKAADGFLQRLRHRQAVAGWARAAEATAADSPARLEALRAQARELRRHLDRVVLLADDRLGAAAGGDGCDRLPAGTDWHWRPDLWLGRLAEPGLASAAPGSNLGGSLALFHDCPHRELSLRQIRNPGRDGLPPFGLALDVFGFAGSFLSLAIDLPEAAAQGLQLRHVVRVDAVVDCERAIGLFARLNIEHGPNVARIPLHVDPVQGPLSAEFDLAYSGINDRRLGKIWLDLIFGDPAMNRITLRDLMLSRRPRAEL